MTPHTTILTKRCRAEVFWYDNKQMNDLVNVNELVIQIDQHNQWTADYFHSVIRELVGELLKFLHHSNRIHIRVPIRLRYPDHHLLTLDEHRTMRYLSEAMVGLSLGQLHGGEFQPNQNHPFPIITDEFNKKVDVRVRKLRLVGRQVKQLVHFMGLDLKVNDFRVVLLNQLPTRTGSKQPIVGLAVVEMKITIYDDQPKTGLINQLILRQLRLVVERLADKVTDAQTNVVLYHSVEKK